MMPLSGVARFGFLVRRSSLKTAISAGLENAQHDKQEASDTHREGADGESLACTLRISESVLEPSVAPQRQSMLLNVLVRVLKRFGVLSQPSRLTCGAAAVLVRGGVSHR